MEKLSRVKKFEDLRKQIENNSVGIHDNPETQTQDFTQNLNDINPSIFKKVNISDEESYTPERERKSTSYELEDDPTTGDFRNEYLDDFINEVREYNIKKGNRENENTQIDILNQLNAVNRVKRSNYVENIEDAAEAKKVVEEKAIEQKVSGTTSMSKEEIANEVANLLKEDNQLTLNAMGLVREEDEDLEDTIPLFTQEIIKEAEIVKPIVEIAIPEKPIVNEAVPVRNNPREMENTNSLDVREIHPKIKENLSLHKDDDSNTSNAKENPFTSRKTKPTVVPSKDEQEEVERERLLQQKLVEETQQLRVQLNEYEDDLNGLSEGVEKTNKLLNVILGFLILALLVIIGVIIYWVVNAGGLV